MRDLASRCESWAYGWWTRSQRLRTLAAVRLDVELRDPLVTPVYQRIAAEAAAMQDEGVRVAATARHFGVDYHSADKAIRWFRGW